VKRPNYIISHPITHRARNVGERVIRNTNHNYLDMTDNSLDLDLENGSYNSSERCSRHCSRVNIGKLVI